MAGPRARAGDVTPLGGDALDSSAGAGAPAAEQALCQHPRPHGSSMSAPAAYCSCTCGGSNGSLYWADDNRLGWLTDGWAALRVGCAGYCCSAGARTEVIAVLPAVWLGSACIKRMLKSGLPWLVLALWLSCRGDKKSGAKLELQEAALKLNQAQVWVLS